MIQLRNFLSEVSLSRIKNKFINPKYRWLKQDTAVPNGKLLDANYIESPVYRNVVLIKDKKFNGYVEIYPIIKKLELAFNDKLEFTQIAVNFLPSDSTVLGKRTSPHIDMQYSDEIYKNCKTFTGIYYINSCDGDTYFYDDDHKKISSINPEENKLCLWDSRTIHSAPASALVDRYVINLNFICYKSTP
jgi:hypothetical protein